MECMYCGQEFDTEGVEELFDELLAHLEAEHPEVIDAIDEWPAYQDWEEGSAEKE